MLFRPECFRTSEIHSVGIIIHLGFRGKGISRTLQYYKDRHPLGSVQWGSHPTGGSPRGRSPAACPQRSKLHLIADRDLLGQVSPFNPALVLSPENISLNAISLGLASGIGALAMQFVRVERFDRDYRWVCRKTVRRKNWVPPASCWNFWKNSATREASVLAIASFSRTCRGRPVSGSISSANGASAGLYRPRGSLGIARPENGSVTAPASPALPHRITAAPAFSAPPPPDPHCRVAQRYPRPSKVQSVDHRMRLECGVCFRQLGTCRRIRPGQLCAANRRRWPAKARSIQHVPL